MTNKTVDEIRASIKHNQGFLKKIKADENLRKTFSIPEIEGYIKADKKLLKTALQTTR